MKAIVERYRKISGGHLVIAAALSLSLIVQACIVINTYGTNDVISWNEFLQKITAAGGGALYRDVPLFNHPPFMIHLLRFWGELGNLANIPLRISLRATSVLAGAATSLLVCGVVNSGRLAVEPGALVLTVLSPVTILVAGFHGNTDPVMMLFVILAVCLASSGYSPWLVGLCLGIAMNIKLPGILAAPALFFWLRKAQQRAALVVATGLTFVLGSLPWIFTAPKLVFARVFAYSGLVGVWGISLGPRIVAQKLGLQNAFQVAASVEKVCLLLAVVCVSAWMNRGPRRPGLFLQCGFVYFLFLAASPGYGIQYLDWLVIWPVVLGTSVCLLWNLSAGVFLFATYHSWAGGFPWYLAESRWVVARPWHLIVLGQICWLVIVWMAYRFFKVVRRGEE